MPIATIDAEDASFPDNIPGNVLAAGYTTGTPGTNWSKGNGFANHESPYPAIRICQDAGATDTTADILDIEAGAATIADMVGWIKAARENYKNGTRPGQREPAIYLSMGNLSEAVTTLENAGLTGVGFWTAEPGNSHVYAVNRVATATGNYPCIGCQYQFLGSVDKDVFSLPWVTNVSLPVVVPPPSAPVLGKATVKVTLVRVVDTRDVYWWNGTGLWHVSDPAVFTFFKDAGIADSIVSVTAEQLANLGPVVS